MSRFPGLDRMLSQTGATKRDVLASGEFTPTVNLAKIKISEFYPLDADTQLREKLQSPHELIQVFVEPLDVQEGDLLTFGGTDYPVRSSADWSHAGSVYMKRLILEDLKA